MEAVWFSNLEGVRLLLAANADATATDQHGCSCLMVASLQNNVRLWMDLRSSGYQLNTADHGALTRKQELLALFPWSASLLQLPCGFTTPALLTHEPPYALSLAERSLRLQAALPACSAETVQQRLDRLERSAEDGPDRLMEQIDCVRGLVEEAEYERAMWDAKSCIAGRVVAADRFMDPTHTCALFLHLYPWNLSRRVRAAMETWGEGELTSLWPLVDALHSALEALPSAASRTWYRPLGTHPQPGDFSPGSSLLWSSPVSVCSSHEEALELSPSRCILEICTARVRDVSAFSLNILDDEAMLPFATNLTVACVFVDGVAVDGIPLLVPEKSVCVIRLEAASPQSPREAYERCSSPLPPQRSRHSSEWMAADDSASLSCSSNTSSPGRQSPMKPPLHPDAVALSSRRVQLSPEAARGRTGDKGSISASSSPTAVTINPAAGGAQLPPPAKDRNRRLSFTVRKRRIKSLDGQPLRKNASPPRLERPKSYYPSKPTAAGAPTEEALEGGHLRQGSPLSFLHRRPRRSLQSPMRAPVPTHTGVASPVIRLQQLETAEDNVVVEGRRRSSGAMVPENGLRFVRCSNHSQATPRLSSSGNSEPPDTGDQFDIPILREELLMNVPERVEQSVPYKQRMERRRAVVGLLEEDMTGSCGANGSPHGFSPSQASLRIPTSGSSEPLDVGDVHSDIPTPKEEHTVSVLEKSVTLQLPTDTPTPSSPHSPLYPERTPSDNSAAAGGFSPGASMMALPRRPLPMEPLSRAQLSSPLRFRLTSLSSPPVSNAASPSASVDKAEDRLSVFQRVFRRSNSVSGR
eukprot:GGOE01021803.1.p1 GENE.GGOE01021803.1~~GGOE01021803.1.p1  ORF type:complete len:880 (-),score=208.63 GGOE01021803.1:423-2852(-)